METEDMLKVLEGMKSLLEIKQKMKHEKEVEDEEYSEELKSLQADYEAFMRWAVGDKSPLKKAQAIKIWKELHPDLPIPRIFFVDEGVSAPYSSMLFVLDGYHLYLKEKDRICSCATKK